MSGHELTIAPDFSALIPSQRVGGWVFAGHHLVPFVGSNASALVMLLIPYLTDEQLDDQLQNAHRTGAMVFLVCADPVLVEEAAADVAVRLPKHRRVPVEYVATGCVGLPH